MAQYELDGGGLTVKGILDTPEVEEFENNCRELLSLGNQMVFLDLSAVTFISSACAGILLSLRSETEEQGKKFNLASSPEVKKVLDLIGFSDLTGTGS